MAEGALQDLLGTQAGQVQASQAAADGQPPAVTMQPIPNPEDQDKDKKKDGSLDDVFSQAQQKNQ